MHEPGINGKLIFELLESDIEEKQNYKYKNRDEYENRADTGRNF